MDRHCKAEPSDAVGYSPASVSCTGLISPSGRLVVTNDRGAGTANTLSTTRKAGVHAVSSDSHDRIRAGACPDRRQYPASAPRNVVAAIPSLVVTLFEISGASGRHVGSSRVTVSLNHFCRVGLEAGVGCV